MKNNDSYLRKDFSKITTNLSRAPWSCGLICHVLDWKVEASNLAAAKNIFKLTKISSQKSEQKKKGTISLIESVRAVAVREEEETRRERERSGAII